MIVSLEESAMDPIRAQLENYLDWLESRGLSGTVAFNAAVDAPTRPAETPPLAPTVIHSPARQLVEAEAVQPLASPLPAFPAELRTQAEAPQREAGMPWKVGFYSSSDLTEEEFIMVSKIALALGLPAADFKIWAEDSLVHVPLDLLRCSYIVALGPGSGQTLLALGQTVVMNDIQKALQGSPLLTIPHPRAMLREPPLKGGAWAALQKFKALMS
jgi:hypothetical protein